VRKLLIEGEKGLTEVFSLSNKPKNFEKLDFSCLSYDVFALYWRIVVIVRE
jgi:hypothetical protein